MQYSFSLKCTIPSLFFIVTSSLYNSANATSRPTGDPVVIASDFYHVDEQHKLILINKPVEEITAAAKDSHAFILDKEYIFRAEDAVFDSEHPFALSYANTTYTAYFTKLPIIHIDTRYAIVDAPSVYGKFKMSEASGKVTTANLGVEIRGGFSQNYDKKSYELSFWTDTLGAKSRDVKLLGMRTDNKWNLQALYNEPLRVNSKVANELWRELSQLYYKDEEPDAVSGIAMNYAEVFVNNVYRGVYALTERVDRKQLKLKKYTTSLKGELYKGSDWGGAVDFTQLPDFNNANSTWGGFEYKHPEEYTDWTNLYNFVKFVENSSDAQFLERYKNQFDLRNAVDYYIFLNVLRALDNRGKNLYIAKYDVGRPYFYVPWDLDGSFGNNWIGLNDNVTDDIITNGFYQRLNQDCSVGGFRRVLRNRWAELRTSVLTPEHIMAKFAANTTYLKANNVYQREQAVWSGYRYDEAQLPYVASWLAKRLTYLDGAFSQQCAQEVAAARLPVVQFYPNPADDYLVIEAIAPIYEIYIQDMSGRIVLKSVAQTPMSRLDTSQLLKGMYVVLVKGAHFVATEKLVLN
jgi:spore coat protein H